MFHTQDCKHFKTNFKIHFVLSNNYNLFFFLSTHFTVYVDIKMLIDLNNFNEIRLRKQKKEKKEKKENICT